MYTKTMFQKEEIFNKEDIQFFQIYCSLKHTKFQLGMFQQHENSISLLSSNISTAQKLWGQGTCHGS